ncbi:MAG: DUF2236 domain-containing protein [Bacteroidetes bacterium]|nr:MAG: DUF2236 domain-containing protein [Bacteroidota bacterium]TAG85647.1 MAG: DUF2236 domain-containing protein [Bacteroidota bacterium]
MYYSILTEYRLLGDEKADFLIENTTQNDIFELLKSIQTNESFFKIYPKNDFIDFPAWADKEKIKIAQTFFRKNFRVILSLLGSLSLPYCYAAADGAKVLMYSQRLAKDTKKRLAETAKFVLEIMENDAFEDTGKGFALCFQVRTIHAQIRNKSKKSPHWNLDWGLPINQEDMAGTNLSFSLIILRGMEKLQYKVTAQEADAFLHYWNIIGHLLGLKQELLPKDRKEAFWLDKCIVDRQFKTSEEGKLLAKNLLICLNETLPKNIPEGFLGSYLRFLLGDKIANMIKIPTSNWTTNLLTPLPLISWWQDATQNITPETMKEMIAQETDTLGINIF